MANEQWRMRVQAAEETVKQIISRLPPELRPHASALQITFEPRPSKSMRRDGIEADTLGLFEGDSFADETSSNSTMPRRMLLFLDVIWEEAEGDWSRFREELKITYLHELGHYLGLDESALQDRDLD